MAKTKKAKQKKQKPKEEFTDAECIDNLPAIDGAVESNRAYMNRLIIVAIAANEVVKGAEKVNRYYLRVGRRRFNALGQALEALRKQR